MADKHWSKKFEANKNGLARYKNDYIQHDSIEFLHVSIVYYVFTWEDNYGRQILNEASALLEREIYPINSWTLMIAGQQLLPTKIKVVKLCPNEQMDN